MLRGLPSIIIVCQKLSERWARLEKKTITNRIKQNIFMEAKHKKIQPKKKKIVKQTDNTVLKLLLNENEANMYMIVRNIILF